MSAHRDAGPKTPLVDLVHIGDYKTGTTWLQQQVFRTHPELLYLDWPRANPGITRLFYELVDARDLDFDPVSMRERFQGEIDKISRLGRKLVVSRESLGGDFLSGDNFLRTAQRLHQVFGPVRILLVIREQFSMLASLYSEYVKMGGTLSFGDFIWDPITSRDLIERLQYHKKIRALHQIFGKDRVTVRLYEELRQDPEAFLKGVLSLIGCRDVDFFPCDARPANPALTDAGALVHRGLNRLVRTPWNTAAPLLPLDRLATLCLTGRQKQRLLDHARIQLPGAPLEHSPRHFLRYSVNMAINDRVSRFCERITLGKKLEVPQEPRRKLGPIFAGGNARLARECGLNLKKYGWVL